MQLSNKGPFQQPTTNHYHDLLSSIPLGLNYCNVTARLLLEVTSKDLSERLLAISSPVSSSSKHDDHSQHSNYHREVDYGNCDDDAATA
ncbi:hypothetical protein E4U21_006242 [Claviceps maximensis]|nr:hypothetical protein E4U21_006242 [Claviceps maximensis]